MKSINWFPLWAIPLLVMLSILTVWTRLETVELTYSINQLGATERALQQERARAEVRLASVRSPRRLEPIARDRMGLRPPTTEQIIYIRSDALPVIQRAHSTGKAAQ